MGLCFFEPLDISFVGGFECDATEFALDLLPDPFDLFFNLVEFVATVMVVVAIVDDQLGVKTSDESMLLSLELKGTSRAAITHNGIERTFFRRTGNDYSAEYQQTDIFQFFIVCKNLRPMLGSHQSMLQK